MHRSSKINLIKDYTTNAGLFIYLYSSIFLTPRTRRFTSTTVRLKVFFSIVLKNEPVTNQMKFNIANEAQRSLMPCSNKYPT